MRLGRGRAAAPRRLMLSFVLLLLLPAVAVVWLGVQLLGQDRALEVQRLRERQEVAADRAVAALEQALAATERRLRVPGAALNIRADDDAVLLKLRAAGIEAVPRGHLVYSPTAAMPLPEATSVFDAAEAIEYRLNDPMAAARAFRRLAASPNADVRAGALLRLARNLKRLGQHADALRAYAQLAELRSARVVGLPADLVARRATCVLLHEANRRAELQKTAEALLWDFLEARWSLDRGTFDLYAGEIERWVGGPRVEVAERRALAEAADTLWQQRGAGTLPHAGRLAFATPAGSVTVLWQSTESGMIALAAGPRFQQREWFDAVRADVIARGLAMALTDDSGRGLGAPAALAVRDATARSARATGLPWSVAVAQADAASRHDEFAGRRRMLLAGLSLVLVLVVAGGYSVARAVSREFAVARLQTDFVAAVSHEFRTPLTSLHQFTTLLNDESEPPPAKRRLFYQAQARASERLRRLVESLLDFGRMEAGAHPYQLAAVDVCALVRTVAADFSREVEAQGFTIGCAVPDGALSVHADADALARALWNLLENAAKYSGTSRTIDVSVAVAGDRVCLAVRDRGLGIPRHEQRDIFEKFVRGAASREHGIKGTGIGLAMVRHIVQGHGGTVHVDSTVGEGSTFTLALPRRRPSASHDS